MNNLIPNELDLLLDRQKEAWIAGKRPRVEDFLLNSSLPKNAEAFLDLVYNEIVVREELGENPTIDEYIQNYPHLADDLKLHFEVHAALHDGLVTDTRQILDTDTDANPDEPSTDAALALRDYDVLSELGQGGMGIVYKARQRRLQRLVALKMFRPGRIPTPRELTRFHTEAEAIARLQHPNIVQIFEVGQSQGLPFLALELAEGGTLATRLQALPFTPRAAASLMRTLAGAVRHAQQHQIVHRDLKPANVLFTRDGIPKITDFGLAKILEEPLDSPRDATRTGEPMGTPRYMSPEQAAGHSDQVSPATDIYSLGTLLYECLTGQVPFVSSSAVETMARIREEEPRSPRRLQPVIPRALETICLKCLRKQPSRRYANAADLADDLDRFLGDEPIYARPTPVWERAWMWCRRHPATTALAASAFLAVVAALLIFGVRARRERQRLEALRVDLAVLIRKGQEAVAKNDDKTAEDAFLRALTLVRSEPELRDHELGVSGWLDHSRRQAEQERLQKRRPPPLFEELRDEAVVQCLFLDASPITTPAVVRETIQHAISLTIAGDPVTRRQRELLSLLDADLRLREGDPAGALAVLDQSAGTATRPWHHRRADCLDRLGRNLEANEERVRADKLAPQEALQFFLSGVDRLYRKDAAGAIRDFEQVLLLEPDHFMARLCQGACFLRQHRLGEANVALTACLGQRPHFVWSYLLRAQVRLASNDRDAALRDFQNGLDQNPRSTARAALLTSRGLLYLRLEKWALSCTDFDQALALQPDAPEAWVGRGAMSLLARCLQE